MKKRGNPHRAPKRRERRTSGRAGGTVAGDPERLVIHRELEALRHPTGKRGQGRAEKLDDALIEYPIAKGAVRGDRAEVSLFDLAPRLARAHRAARVERERCLSVTPSARTSVAVRVLEVRRRHGRCDRCAGSEDRLALRVFVVGGVMASRRLWYLALDCPSCGARKISRVTKREATA